MIDVDILTQAGPWPGHETLAPTIERAVSVAALQAGVDPHKTELSVLLTDDRHIAVLNAQWRGKDKPTNVLSFPAPDIAGMTALGDIALAYETIAREADIDAKSFDAHFTHLIVHGFLHLVGHDHIEPAQADNMETLERAILAELGIDDPYAAIADL